jgi:hypothetical protein
MRVSSESHRADPSISGELTGGQSLVPFLSVLDQLPIELVSVLSVVHSAVAIRTESNDVFRGIRPAVTPAMKMMYLQERLT